MRAKKTARNTAGRAAPSAASRAPRARGGARGAASASSAKRDLGAIKGAHEAPLPEDIAPQLATLVERAPGEPGWVYELKFDGYRVLTWIDGGAATFVTRSGQDWSDRMVALKDPVEALPVKSAVLDGEVVVVGPGGTTDFQALQNALREGRDAKLVYYVFDLLYLDGYDLRGARLSDRKELLASLIKGAHPSIRYSEHLEADGAEAYAKACSMALEGLVAKRASSVYRGGRGRDWLKLKCGCRQEFVVGGYTEPSGSRTHLGAILVGVHDPDRGFLYSGKVGTGFDSATLRLMAEKLRAIEVDTSPFKNPPKMRGVHWVAPKLVAEVEFTAWTRGGNLRHPSFMGLREDKPAAQIVREASQPGVKGQAPRVVVREAAPTEEKGEAPVASKRAAVKPEVKGDDTIAGVRLSSPDKVLYPEQGITKRELALYYEAVADHILPHVADRPLTLVRCPEGRGKPCFFQKHTSATSKGPPLGLKPVEIVEKDGPDTYLYLDSTEGLISLVQMGVLEIHVWGSRIDRIEQPDRLVFDLDPAPELAWSAVVRGAKAVRERLRGMGLESFVKTTGGKGLHVVVPIVRGRADWDQVKAFTKAVAVSMAGDFPSLYTAVLTKAKRTNKIFIDYLRNGRGATAVTTFSVRARPGATVSTPVSWEELDKGIRPDEFTVRTVPQRLASLRKDPWEELASMRQSITANMKRGVGLRG